MNDEEIEELITALIGMLNENGFGWAREQAEAAHDPRWHRRWLARALIGAAESVTVDLAEAELFMLSAFGEDVHFKPDDGADPDGAAFLAAERTQSEDTIGAQPGARRRDTLAQLVGMRGEFQLLREQLDGAA